MGGDFQQEAPIMTSIAKLLQRRATERNPTKYKRPRVVSEFLLARIPLFTDELNSLEMFQCTPRDTNGWEDGAKWREQHLPNGRTDARKPRVPTLEV